MKKLLYTWTVCLICLICLYVGSSCSSTEIQTAETDHRKLMTFSMHHPSQMIQTRITDTAFEKGDRIGLYITEATTPLEPSGNYVNNAVLTFTNNSWVSGKNIYWDSGTYNVYAYYPYFKSVSSVDDYAFSVSTEQNTKEGYAQSDFLWAKKANINADMGAVNLQFSHRMSRLVIKLVKGADYEGELPAEADVFIHNTVPQATIDLDAGVVTRDPHASAQTIRAKKLEEQKYAAIVVPQRLNNRLPLVEVVMEGVSYLYESKFLFKPGIQHTILLVISKNPEQVKIEIGGELENWETLD